MTGENTRVLVVDDEEIVRESLSGWLQEDGFQVFTAPEGRTAVEMMKSERWNVMLVDLKMPGMDGLQLLQEIRKTGSKADVIMVTAYGEVESYLKAMSLGAAEYINKPIRIKELKRIVHKVLTERKAKPSI